MSTPAVADDTARLFIALWPTPAVLRAALAWRDGWAWPRTARLVAPDKIHLTLHFIGDVARARIPALIAALDGPAPDFTLVLDQGELWRQGVAVLQPATVPAALHALHERLGAALQQLALPVETRRFRAHLTLARDAHGATPCAPPPAIEWPVDAYCLVQSQGGRYEMIATWPASTAAGRAPAGDNPASETPRATMPDPAIDSQEPTAPVAPPVPMLAPVPETAATPAAASAAAPAGNTDGADEAGAESVALAADEGGAAPGGPKPAELSPAACGARLAELFPALFGPEGPPKPLKLKIQADIQQRAPGVFTRKVLGIFFSRYTTGNAYLKALLNAPHRYDLDGQPAGEIAAEHKAAATEELARRRAIADERRAAEREARRAEEKAAFKARQKAGREAQKTQVVEDHARRERAFLLRAFETSSLTKANFCALKGVSESELDAQLEQARQERAERPPLPPPRSPLPARAAVSADRGPRQGGPGGPGSRPRGTPRPAR